MSIQQSHTGRGLQFALAAIAIITILNGIYISYFFIAVLLIYPNEANYSILGLIAGTLLLIMVALTLSLARSALGRGSGRNNGAATARSYLLVAAIVPLALFLAVLISPTMVIYILFSVSLQLINIFSKPSRARLSATALADR